MVYLCVYIHQFKINSLNKAPRSLISEGGTATKCVPVLYMHIHTYKSEHTHTHTLTHSLTHTHTLSRALAHTHAHTHTQTHTRTLTHSRTHTHTQTHTHKHTNTHTHTHTHTHVPQVTDHAQKLAGFLSHADLAWN